MFSSSLNIILRVCVVRNPYFFRSSGVYLFLDEYRLKLNEVFVYLQTNLTRAQVFLNEKNSRFVVMLIYRLALTKKLGLSLIEIPVFVS